MPYIIDDDKFSFMCDLFNSYLVDQCDVEYQDLIPSGAGDAVRQYVLIPGGGNLPCRVEQIQFRASQLEAYAGKEVISLVYKFYFPVGSVVIKPNYRISFKGAKYEIRTIVSDGTQLPYIACHTSRIA